MATVEERINKAIDDIARGSHGLKWLAQKWFGGVHPGMGSMPDVVISQTNKDLLLNDAWDELDNVEAAIVALKLDLPARP